MREIKFRAWSEQNGMFYPDSLTFNRGGSIANLFQHNNLGEGEKIKSHITPVHGAVELMQYTGLKDKNSVEIYEGDIVNVPYGRFKDEDNDRILDYITCVVTQSRSGWFAKPTLGKKTLYKRQGKRQQMFYEHTELVEVIGNIYENPELLEKKS